jgi:hypothetical protein
MLDSGSSKDKTLTEMAVLFHAAIEERHGARDVDVEAVARALGLSSDQVDRQRAAAVRFGGAEPPGEAGRARLLRRCVEHARESGPETPAEQELLSKLELALEMVPGQAREVAASSLSAKKGRKRGSRDEPDDGPLRRAAGPSWLEEDARTKRFAGRGMNKIVSAVGALMGFSLAALSYLAGNPEAFGNHLIRALVALLALVMELRRFEGERVGWVLGLLLLTTYEYVARTMVGVFVVLAAG